MQSKEKATEEVVLIRYYNVLFYLFFKAGRDDFKRQCLVDRIDAGESMRMKQIQDWCSYHQIPFKTIYIYIEKILKLEPTYGIYILIFDLDLKFGRSG